jgi:hypothetical protein
MDSRKSTSGILSTGSLVLTVIQSVHPRWLGDNPWIFPLALGVFAISLLYFLLQFRWVQQLFGIQAGLNEKPLERAVEAKDRSNAIGGDANSSILDSSSGPRYVGTDAIKAHLDYELEMAGKKSSLAPPEPPKPTIELPTLRLEIIRQSVEVSDWIVNFADKGGEPCYAVSVLNREPKTVGEHAVVAQSLSACIEFNSLAIVPQRVNHACWIGEGQHEISLRPGVAAYVLLGVTRKDDWVAYNNPNRYLVEWPSPAHWLKEVIVPLYPNVEITGTISIMSSRNNKAIALASRTFLITMDRGGVFVNARWNDEARI